MSLYEIKTPFGVPVIARDAPVKVRRMLNEEELAAAMAADAKGCRARLNKVWDHSQPSGPQCNIRRTEIAKAKHEANAERLLALMIERGGEMTRAEMMHALDLTESTARLANIILRDQGKIKCKRVGSTYTWSIA
jgi:DNA-binding transcriptional ArsR family regulator